MSIRPVFYRDIVFEEQLVIRSLKGDWLERFQALLHEPLQEGFITFQQLLQVVNQYLPRSAEIYLVGSAVQQVVFNRPKNDYDLAIFIQDEGEFHSFASHFQLYLESEWGVQPHEIRINRKFRVFSFRNCDIKFPHPIDRTHLFDADAWAIRVTEHNSHLTLIPRALTGRSYKALEYVLHLNQQKQIVLQNPETAQKHPLRFTLKITQDWYADQPLIKDVMQILFLEEGNFEAFQRTLDLFIQRHIPTLEEVRLFLFNLHSLLTRYEAPLFLKTVVIRAFPSVDQETLQQAKGALLLQCLETVAPYHLESGSFHLGNQRFFLEQDFHLELKESASRSQQRCIAALKSWISGAESLERKKRGQLIQDFLKEFSREDFSELVQGMEHFFAENAEEERFEMFLRLTFSGKVGAVLARNLANLREARHLIEIEADTHLSLSEALCLAEILGRVIPNHGRFAALQERIKTELSGKLEDIFLHLHNLSGIESALSTLFSLLWIHPIDEISLERLWEALLLQQQYGESVPTDLSDQTLGYWVLWLKSRFLKGGTGIQVEDLQRAILPACIDAWVKIWIKENRLSTAEKSLSYFSEESESPFDDVAYFSFLDRFHADALISGYIEYAWMQRSNLEHSGATDPKYLLFLRTQMKSTLSTKIQQLIENRLIDLEVCTKEADTKILYAAYLKKRFTLKQLFVAKGKDPVWEVFLNQEASNQVMQDFLQASQECPQKLQFIFLKKLAQLLKQVAFDSAEQRLILGWVQKHCPKGKEGREWRKRLVTLRERNGLVPQVGGEELIDFVEQEVDGAINLMIDRIEKTPHDFTHWERLVRLGKKFTRLLPILVKKLCRSGTDELLLKDLFLGCLRESLDIQPFLGIKGLQLESMISLKEYRAQDKAIDAWQQKKGYSFLFYWSLLKSAIENDPLYVEEFADKLYEFFSQKSQKIEIKNQLLELKDWPLTLYSLALTIGKDLSDVSLQLTAIHSICRHDPKSFVELCEEQQSLLQEATESSKSGGKKESLTRLAQTVLESYWNTSHLLNRDYKLLVTSYRSLFSATSPEGRFLEVHDQLIVYQGENQASLTKFFQNFADFQTSLERFMRAHTGVKRIDLILPTFYLIDHLVTLCAQENGIEEKIGAQILARFLWVIPVIAQLGKIGRHVCTSQDMDVEESGTATHLDKVVYNVLTKIFQCIKHTGVHSRHVLSFMEKDPTGEFPLSDQRKWILVVDLIKYLAMRLGEDPQELDADVGSLRSLFALLTSNFEDAMRTGFILPFAPIVIPKLFKLLNGMGNLLGDDFALLARLSVEICEIMEKREPEALKRALAEEKPLIFECSKKICGYFVMMEDPNRLRSRWGNLCKMADLRPVDLQKIRLICVQGDCMDQLIQAVFDLPSFTLLFDQILTKMGAERRIEYLQNLFKAIEYQVIFNHSLPAVERAEKALAVLRWLLVKLASPKWMEELQLTQCTVVQREQLKSSGLEIVLTNLERHFFTNIHFQLVDLIVLLFKDWLCTAVSIEGLKVERAGMHVVKVVQLMILSLEKTKDKDQLITEFFQFVDMVRVYHEAPVVAECHDEFEQECVLFALKIAAENGTAKEMVHQFYHQARKDLVSCAEQRSTFSTNDLLFIRRRIEVLKEAMRFFMRTRKILPQELQEMKLIQNTFS